MAKTRVYSSWATCLFRPGGSVPGDARRRFDSVVGEFDVLNEPLDGVSGERDAAAAIHAAAGGAIGVEVAAGPVVAGARLGVAHAAPSSARMPSSRIWRLHAWSHRRHTGR